MAARRALTLALPPSDPRSAIVWAHLDSLEGADSSAELRRLICQALAVEAELVSLHAKLDRLLAGGIAPAAEPEPAIDPADVGALLDFGV